MKRIYVFTMTALAALMPIWGCIGDRGPRCRYGFMGSWDHMIDYEYGGMVMWIFFLIIIAVLLYFALYFVKSKKTGENFKEEPLTILKKRYARGEISKDEFDRMKNDLQ